MITVSEQQSFFFSGVTSSCIISNIHTIIIMLTVYLLPLSFQFLLKCGFVSAPNRPPGNVSWKAEGSWVKVRWDNVKAMHNESAILGYKVSNVK